MQRTLLFVASLGCSVTPATQFTVGVESQILVPEDVQSVRITASTGGNRGFCQTYPVVDGKARLPQSLALAPDTASDPTLQVTVNVMAFTASQTRVEQEATYDDCTIPIVSPADSSTEDPSSAPPNGRILRRSTQSYAMNHNLFVPMPLKYACYGVNCPGDQTCRGGECVDATPPFALPDYDDALLLGTSSTCFDEAVCLADATGPTIIDAANCIYEVPAGASLAAKGMNVRAIYEPYRAEVLDLAATEGFTVPDPTKPNRFQLAQGLCSGMGPKIKNLVASTSCPSKNVFQPICATDATTVVLPPTPSAVYLAVDQDPTMVDYIGTKNPMSTSVDKSGSLDSALALALGDPVFLTTEVALRFVPDPGMECGSTGYGTPTKAFTTVDLAIQPLVQAIGQQLPQPTSGLALNGLLASTGLFSLAAPAATLNHKALVFVTNRSLDPTLASNCAPNGAAAAVKAAAMAGFETWVFSLRYAFETMTDRAARIAAAQAFQQASGARLIAAEGGASGDESMAEIAAAEGLAELVATLGSCLYDKPSNLSDPTKATLLLQPAGPFAQSTIPLDTTCAAGSSTANGWAVSQDGAHIRVCGEACTLIQDAIQANALLTAQRDQTAPTMPGQVLVELSIP